MAEYCEERKRRATLTVYHQQQHEQIRLKRVAECQLIVLERERTQSKKERDVERLNHRKRESTKTAEIPSSKQQTKGLGHKQRPPFDVDHI